MSTVDLIEQAPVMNSRPAWHKQAISIRVDYSGKGAVSDMAGVLDLCAAKRGFAISEVVRVERGDISAIYARGKETAE